MRKSLSLFVVAAAAFGMTSTANAAKVFEKGDKSLTVGGYMQPRLGVNLDANPGDADGVADRTYDFYVRRVRLKFAGKINKKIGFNIITLTPDINRHGKDFPTSLADAWIEYTHSPALKINMGLLKLPFARHMGQGGGGLHGMDFHGSFLNTRDGEIAGRDVGIMARGLVANKKIDYRVAVVDGIEPGGEDRLPRVVGRVGYNLFDAQPEYFWKGTYLGKKKVVSFGLSFDVQPGVVGAEGDEMYAAYAFDAMIDYPMGNNAFVMNVNALYFGDKLDGYGDLAAKPKSGMGLWFDAGYRMGKIEPIVSYERCLPDNEGDDMTGACEAILAGVNYWALGHKYNIKTEFGMRRKGEGDDWSDYAKEFIVQAHMGF